MVEDMDVKLSSAVKTELSGRLNSVPIIVITAAIIHDMVGLDPDTPILVSGIEAAFCINYNSKKSEFS